MNKIFNIKPYQERRRQLRKNMTEAEVILWSKLRSRQVNNYRFRRQVGIGKYIVDFYCPELRLAIEIDGDLHFLEQKTIYYDKKRQREIESLGVKFLRGGENHINSAIATSTPATTIINSATITRKI